MSCNMKVGRKMGYRPSFLKSPRILNKLRGIPHLKTIMDKSTDLGGFNWMTVIPVCDAKTS